ncbi:MAG: hypothetical protein ACODAJ_10260, partial [Planctomycetota bacterium]
CVPVAMGIGALVFGALGAPLSRMHMQVQTAERVWLEEQGEVEGETDASKAFRRTGRPPEELYADALAIREEVRTVGWGAGAVVGLLVALRVIGVSIRRRHSDYQADRARCLACGRCFEYCPIERRRRKGEDDA